MSQYKRYPKYKPSGFDWIGDIPEGWNIERLASVGIFSSSGIDKKTVEGEQLVSMVNYTDIYGNEARTLRKDREYMVVSCPESKRREHQVRYGDLIFTPSSETIEDIGLSAVVDEDLPNTVFSYHVVRLIFQKEMWHEYKKYLCNNSFVLSQFSRLAKGTTRQILGRFDFRSTKVVVPPVDDQREISKYLDRKSAQIDQLIQKKEQAITLLKEKRATIINQAVTRGLDLNVKMKSSGVVWIGDVPEGWECRRLRFLIREPLKYGANEIANEDDQTLPRYIRITDFDENGLLRPDSFRSLPIEIAKKYFLTDGDILFARSGATVEKTFQFKNYHGQACFAGYLIKVSPNEKLIKSDYLYYFTKSFAYENWKNSIFSQATIQNIGADKYQELIVSFPKDEMEQLEIIKYLDRKTQNIERLINEIESAINRLREYRSSLITAAVTGKIDVREVNV